MLREIPEGAELLQTGLYVYRYERVIAGRVYLAGAIYSSEGYCYYDLEQAENYDDEGNLVPAENRVYAQYQTLSITSASQTNEQLNQRFVSVPVDPTYEIANIGNQTEMETLNVEKIENSNNTSLGGDE